MPIAITPDGGKLVIRATEDVVRFNSLPFRSDFDTSAQELAIARLIERTPELPLTCGSLREFCESIARELGVRIEARLDGTLNTAPAQPRSQMQLTVVDNAACFIAPKTSYFLVSDLENIAHAGSSRWHLRRSAGLSASVRQSRQVTGLRTGGDCSIHSRQIQAKGE